MGDHPSCQAARRHIAYVGLTGGWSGSREDEPGCLRFDVFQDDKGPNTIYFYKVYRDEPRLRHTARRPLSRGGNLAADWLVVRVRLRCSRANGIPLVPGITID